MLFERIATTPNGDAPAEQLIGRPPVYVQSTLTLRQAAAVLDDDRIGVVLVRARGRLAGLLSERDVLRALAEGADPDSERVADVMTEELERMPAGTPIGEVGDLMLADENCHLPVTDGGVVLGGVSMRDVLAPLLHGA